MKLFVNVNMSIKMFNLVRLHQLLYSATYLASYQISMLAKQSEIRQPKSFSTDLLAFQGYIKTELKTHSNRTNKKLVWLVELNELLF